MRVLLALFLISAPVAVLPVARTPALGESTVLELKAGDVAPAFSLPGSDGRTYRLSDYAGKQAVVLAWFAKAFTSG